MKGGDMGQDNVLPLQHLHAFWRQPAASPSTVHWGAGHPFQAWQAFTFCDAGANLSPCFTLCSSSTVTVTTSTQ